MKFLSKIKKGSFLVKLSVSIVIAYILLFGLGSFDRIRPYNLASQMKLYVLSLGYWAVVTAYLTFGFSYFKYNFRNFVLVFACLILSIVFYWTASPAFLSLMPRDYVAIGEYLRDTHEINIFFMDLHRYAITEVLIGIPFTATVLYTLFRLILGKLSTRIQHKLGIEKTTFNQEINLVAIFIFTLCWLAVIVFIGRGLIIF